MDEQGFARTVTLLAVFGLLKFNLGQKCDKSSYALINDPYRSTNATYGYALYQGICDKYIVEELWYRFDSYVGNKIPERAADESVAGYRCGTLNPVFIVGLDSHPTEDNQTTDAAVSAGSKSSPTWSATIQIHKCPAQANAQSYFLYKLKKVPRCDMAYCAGEGVPCSRDDQWNGSACVTTPEPCENYQFINMANGFRSSDYDSWHSTIALCDANIDPGTWYRFQHISGNRLVKGPIDPWYCGTEAPIWLNGDHPTGAIETTVQACATFDTQRFCQWSGFVRIRLCSAFSEMFYIYRLPVPPGCPLSYCVDEATRGNCTPPEVWISNECRYGEPTSAATTVSPKIPVSTIFAPDPTFGPGGWGSWEPWSECSSQCGFGLYTRRRLCAQFDLPCDGQSTEVTSCSKSPCEGNPEERKEGIILILGSANSTKDALSLVLLNEDIIYEMLRLSINTICSNNASLCCGSNFTGDATHDVQFVTLGNVYQFPGSLHVVSGSGGHVSIQIIAVVDESVYQTVCRNGPARRKRNVIKHFVSFSTWLMAVSDIVKTLLETTGVIIESSTSPKAGGGESANSCPVSTCVVPLVIAILGVIGAIVGIVPPVLKFHERSRTGTKKAPSQESLPLSTNRKNSDDRNDKKEIKASQKSATKQNPVYFGATYHFKVVETNRGPAELKA